MKKHISILGSTGSIGRNTLSIVRMFPQSYSVIDINQCAEEKPQVLRPLFYLVPEKEKVQDNCEGNADNKENRVGKELLTHGLIDQFLKVSCKRDS